MVIALNTLLHYYITMPEADNSKKRETTSIRIDPELWHRAKIYALESHMSISELVEKLLEKELGKKK